MSNRLAQSKVLQGRFFVIDGEKINTPVPHRLHRNIGETTDLAQLLRRQIEQQLQLARREVLGRLLALEEMDLANQGQRSLRRARLIVRVSGENRLVAIDPCKAIGAAADGFLGEFG